jgi:hypothetical protein
VAEITDDLHYPRYYLDFETVQFAVPEWAGTRPYEQIPSPEKILARISSEASWPVSARQGRS